MLSPHPHAATASTRPLLGLVVLGLALLAGCSKTFTVVDAANGQPLGNLPVQVSVDTGIRCAEAPCPSQTEPWRGRSTAKGEVPVPAEAKDGVTVFVGVEGFIHQAVTWPVKRLAFQREPPVDVAPVPVAAPEPPAAHPPATGAGSVKGTCPDTLCPAGQRCVLVEVHCARAPCPPMQECVAP